MESRRPPLSPRSKDHDRDESAPLHDLGRRAGRAAGRRPRRETPGVAPPRVRAPSTPASPRGPRSVQLRRGRSLPGDRARAAARRSTPRAHGLPDRRAFADNARCSSAPVPSCAPISDASRIPVRTRRRSSCPTLHPPPKPNSLSSAAKSAARQVSDAPVLGDGSSLPAPRAPALGSFRRVSVPLTSKCDGKPSRASTTHRVTRR